MISTHLFGLLSRNNYIQLFSFVTPKKKSYAQKNALKKPTTTTTTTQTNKQALRSTTSHVEMFTTTTTSSFSSGCCCFQESAVKAARELRRRAEKKEEDESDDAFARALREALVFSATTTGDDGTLEPLSAKNIALKTEQKVTKIVNKRLERAKKMAADEQCWKNERAIHLRLKNNKKKKLKPGSAPSTRRITKPLQNWMFENILDPFPTKEEKIKLAAETGMSIGQISNWCINFRGRRLRPLVRELVEEAKRTNNGGYITQ